MNIEVLFFGQIRELTGKHREEITIRESARLIDLIEQLTEQYGIAFSHEVNHIKGLRILISGREYGLLGGIGAPLKDGDTVVLLPPIAGG